MSSLFKCNLGARFEDRSFNTTHGHPASSPSSFIINHPHPRPRGVRVGASACHAPLFVIYGIRTTRYLYVPTPESGI